MPPMTGGQAVVAALVREGVEMVFGIPGVHTLDIYDALYDRTIPRHILARHEEGAAFMADGYARVSGKAGVVLTTTGPGVTNSATAVGEAYADGVPLVLIHSEVDSRYRGKGNLHELKDQRGMLSAITKWGARAERAADIPRLIHAALERARSGWPGPTYVEIPLDVLAEEGPVPLGQIAFTQTLKSLRLKGASIPPMAFGHGRLYPLPNKQTLVTTYHPSQQNTQTGRLTRAMFHHVFDLVKKRLLEVS